MIELIRANQQISCSEPKQEKPTVTGDEHCYVSQHHGRQNGTSSTQSVGNLGEVNSFPTRRWLKCQRYS